MTPGNVRSFKALVSKAAVTVQCDDGTGAAGTMDLTLRSMGHVRIADVLFSYPQTREVLTAFVDAQSAGRGAVAAPGQGGTLVEAARAAAAGTGMSVGSFVALLVSEAPNLVSQLIVESVERAPAESLDDLIDLVRSQDVDVVVGALMTWVRLNFSRGLDPLLTAAKLLGLKAKAAPAAPPAPASDPASGSTSTPAASPSDAPVPEPVGSTV